MKVVAIGGGTGLSTLLRGLKHHVAEPSRPAQLQPAIARLTAVVTVTDEGGSSGRVRREFRILPYIFPSAQSASGRSAMRFVGLLIPIVRHS